MKSSDRDNPKAESPDNPPPHSDNIFNGDDLHFYSEENHWYALYTRSRAEKRVHIALQNKMKNELIPQINFFLPLQKVKSRWSDRIKEVEKPIIPGYVFVEARLSNYLWRELILTPGVSNLLHRGTEPLIVPPSDIKIIEQIMNSKLPLTSYLMLQEGQNVIVKKGPLQGVEGILLKINPNTNKLVVNFPLLNRSVRTTIDIWDVEPV